MILSKIGLSVLSGPRQDTANTQLAATLYAFGVGLMPENPYTTEAGDGVSGVRVVWHFKPASESGQDTRRIVEHWVNETWCERNESHSLVQCKRAFGHFGDLMEVVRGHPGGFQRLRGNDSISTHDTRQAACMMALGHDCLGWSRTDDSFYWHFPRTAAADMALYLDQHLNDKLPNENITYVRTSMDNHELMVKLIKTVMLARVEHKKRVLRIGRNASPELVNMFEKYLYRK